MPAFTSVACRLARTVAAVAATALLPLALHAQTARNHAGSYSFEVLSPNGAVKAVMTLEKRGEGYVGTINPEGIPAVQITRVVPTDSGAVFEAATPEGDPVVLIAKLTPDNRFLGRVSYGGIEMPFAGTFAPAAAASAGAMNAAGRLDGTTTEPLMGASAFPFSCVITRNAAGSYGGGCAPADQSHDTAPLTSVTVAGTTVSATGTSPMGGYTLQFTVEGTKATGTITVDGQTAKFAGTFTAAAR